MIRINFQPSTTAQLEKIQVQTRLECAKTGMGKLPGWDQVRVSSISGNARRVLDICKSKLSFPLFSVGSFKPVNSCRRTVEFVHATRITVRVGEVKKVIQLMQNSPTTAYLQDCSFHEQMMLASLGGGDQMGRGQCFIPTSCYHTLSVRWR